MRRPKHLHSPLLIIPDFDVTHPDPMATGAIPTQVVKLTPHIKYMLGQAEVGLVLQSKFASVGVRRPDTFGELCDTTEGFSGVFPKKTSV